MVYLRLFLAPIFLTGCATAASNAVASSINPNRDRWQEMQQEGARKQYLDSNAHSSTCWHGVVSSAGPLGGPLTGVQVDAQLNSHPTTTRTDHAGRFGVCATREHLGLGGALVDQQYADRLIHIRLRFTREGYEPKELETDLKTGTKHDDWAIVLDRNK